MNIDKIEAALKNISLKVNKDSFIYDFLLAFEIPKSSISRLKKGDYNKSKIDGEIIWTKKIYFKTVSKNEDVHDEIDEISKSNDIEKHKIRFVIVTDFKTFLSKDIKTEDTLDIELSKLNESLNFFLPLIGREKVTLDKENPADIKASNQMGKLYEQIIRDNEKFNLDQNRDHLNLFFTRLLFLYYADDSEIFTKNQFLKVVSEFTNEDGSELNNFFNDLFQILNSQNRSNVPVYFKEFPYVNGNLFDGKVKLPNFTKTTRKMIIEGASLDWHLINPDILGSMLQSIVSPDERDEDEMHYTSVPNILKVIKPLFLDDLEHRVDQANENEIKLKKILRYIYNSKFFDPACGSGNFLIITYIQLCLLEIRIFKILNRINPDDWKMSMPGISIRQFYGIEKSHYACETAKLSLWIAEHQMNLHFKEVFGRIKPSLPLVESQNILNGNSADINWITFCKKDKLTEHIFLISNPPYKGFSRQTLNQKKDMENCFKNFKGYKRLDYITLWVFKAKQFILFNKDSSCSFVSTNSLCQGEQINIFWPSILDEIQISFAVKSFPWGNNAKNNAVVSCIIIGLGIKDNKDKFIIDGSNIEKCKNINPYLSSIETNEIRKRDKPFCNEFPRMIGGNMPYDGGYLKLDTNQYNEITQKYPESKKFLRKLLGGSEFIHGKKRWVLWIDNADLNDAIKVPEIKKRIDLVRSFRENSGDVARGLAKRSHQFRFRNEATKNFILVPYTSTKDRSYLPIGFIDKEYIVLNSAIVIFDPPLYMFGILSSHSHFLWVLNVSGKMKNDIRYSSSLCYNTFPINELTHEVIKKIEETSLAIIDEREKYSNDTISNLYGKNMPLSLKKLHQKNDEIIDEYLFGKKKYDDEEKVKMLFKMFNKLNSSDTLL